MSDPTGQALAETVKGRALLHPAKIVLEDGKLVAYSVPKPVLALVSEKD